MKFYRGLLSLSIPFILAACGSDSSSNSSPKKNTGVFLDSPVVNIGYRTDSLEGVTNSLGQFEYLSGEAITFFIGDLEFPSTAAMATVTPLNIAETESFSNSKVINMIRLLQTLDMDGDADNGLTMTDVAKSAATQVDFSLSESEFENSTAVTVLIANAGQDEIILELISTEKAVEHFSNQVKSTYSINDMVGYWDIEGEQPGDPGFDADYEIYSDNSSFDAPCNDNFISGIYSISNTGEVNQTYNESGEDPFTATGQMNVSRNRIVFLEGTDEEFIVVKVVGAPNNCDGTVSGVRIIPTADSISVDGLVDDWSGISALVSDQSGDGGIYDGLDVTKIYLAQDTTSLYVRMQMTGTNRPPSPEAHNYWLYFESDDFEFAIEAFHSPSVDARLWDITGANRNYNQQTMIGQLTSYSSGDVIEVIVPKSMISISTDYHIDFFTHYTVNDNWEDNGDNKAETSAHVTF